MAAPGAFRGTNKIMERCPECGSRKPKELVEGGKELNIPLYIVLSLFTCGFGLLLFPFCMKRSIMAYCHECDYSFHPRV